MSRFFRHHPHEWGGWGRPGGGWSRMHRARRGDIGPALLIALETKPMHGYELIGHLEKTSHGMWRPSAGSVYPTLQLLEEQELVVGRDEAGKKVYELTDQGRKAAAEAETDHPWEKADFDPERGRVLKEMAVGMIRPIRQITLRGTKEEFEQAKAILEETKTKLAAIGHEEKP